MLPGLGWRDRVLDMLEVVGLDRPVCPRAGRNTRLDDFGHTTGRRDGHHLTPVREEGLPLTRRAARSGCRACEEVDGLGGRRPLVKQHDSVSTLAPNYFLL